MSVQPAGFELRRAGNQWFASKAGRRAWRYLVRTGLCCLLYFRVMVLHASPTALDNNLQVRLVLYTTNNSGAPSTRIARDPRNNQLYYLKQNGDIFQVDLQPSDGSTSSRRYSATDHGISESALGMAIAADGTIYIIGNTTTNNGNSTFARVMKGVPDSTGSRTW